MTGLTQLLAGIALVVMLCVFAFGRQRSARRAAGESSDLEGDFWGPFSLEKVARRARHEARAAGVAAGEGRPIARRVEDLPSRKWIVERVEERIGELRGEFAVEQRRMDEEIEVARREEQHLGERLTELQDEYDDLRRRREADRERPRKEQDLGLERKLQQVERSLRDTRAKHAEAQLQMERLDQRRERSAGEFDAHATHLHEACDTLRMEHDMAYEIAEHSHKGGQPASAGMAGELPAIEPLLDVAAISEGARREGRRAGLAAAHGNPIATDLEELPSRRWVVERFSEHTSAVRAQLARYQREIGEELEVIAEHIREADRAIERSEAAVAAASSRRRSDEPGYSPDRSRERQNAQRELDAARGRRHEFELQRERLDARLKRAEADFQAVIDQLNDARAAAVAEHDMAYKAAEHHAPPADESVAAPGGSPVAGEPAAAGPAEAPSLPESALKPLTESA